METSILSETAKQVPQLAVLCFVVWMFLQRLTGLAEVIRDLHKEHLDAREQSREAIRDNTRASEHAARAAEENTAVLTRMIKLLERQRDKTPV